VIFPTQSYRRLVKEIRLIKYTPLDRTLIYENNNLTLASPDPTITPPIFWTEVFSRPDARWIPVDPIRSIVNKRKVFDPTPTTSSPSPAVHSALFPSAYAAALARRPLAVNMRATRQENRMVYVMAFEEDGYARDVTRRYAKEFSAKIAKVQGGSSTIGGGKGRQAWWERVVSLVSRPYRLVRLCSLLARGRP